jgi:hypothetical protein
MCEDKIMKPPKTLFENGSVQREEMGIYWKGQVVQIIVCTWVELSQWNPLVLLMNANTKVE